MQAAWDQIFWTVVQPILVDVIGLDAAHTAPLQEFPATPMAWVRARTDASV
jgi:hypothetical protein